MSSTTTQNTIAILRHIFSSYGLQEQLVSDNGSEFRSSEFAEFMKQNGIQHIFTAPYHPSSNGAVERLVQSFKRAMKSSEKEGTTLEQRLSNFLLSYRTTPHVTTNVTPAELFLNRSLRTRLDLLKPNVAVYVSGKQAHQKSDHDNCRRGRVFEVGQTVMCRNYRSGPSWIHGTIAEKTGPLSYVVKTTEGLLWRRQVDQIQLCDSVGTEEVDQAPSKGMVDDDDIHTYGPSSPSEQFDTTSSERSLDTPERRYPLRHRRHPDRFTS